MKKDKNFKNKTIIISLMTVGILTLALFNHGSNKLAAQFGGGGGGYTCYIPEGETEIRDLIINDSSRNGLIYKTRGTLTRIQQSETGQYRAFMQRTNGEDCTKSSLMLTQYNDPNFNVAAGNVIDVEGAYFYDNVPQLQGYANGNHYGTTVVAESNPNPVEEWVMNLDAFKDFLAQSSFRDVSRLVTLKHVMFDAPVTGTVTSFDQDIYVDNGIFDSVDKDEEPANIETVSLVISAFNTAKTNELVDELNAHIAKNAIFELTGVITYLSSREEYVLMLVDADDILIIDEKEELDFEAMIADLEVQLGRTLEDDEKEALPFILALMDELNVDEPQKLMGADEEIEAELKRTLDIEESAALLIFRVLFVELEVKSAINNLQVQLERKLTEDERNAVPFVLALMDELDTDGPFMLMGTDLEIEGLLGRYLSAEESAALDVFRPLFLEMQGKALITMIEEQLDRPMNQTELDAMPLIAMLMIKLEVVNPEPLLGTDGEIAALLGDSLSSEESAALVVFRAINMEIQAKSFSAIFEGFLGRPFTNQERDAMTLIFTLMVELELDDVGPLLGSDDEINEMLGSRTLTPDEIEALIVFRSIVIEISGDEPLGEAEAYIIKLEGELGRFMSNEEKDAIPFVLAVMNNPGIEGEKTLMRTDEEIVVLIGRQLLSPESSALVLFRQLYIEKRVKEFTANLITILKRPLEQEELDAIPFITALTIELDIEEGPVDLLKSDEEINLLLSPRSLTTDESEALIVFRKLWAEMFSGNGGGT